MNYLVTGGYGFIGSNFCHLLIKKGHEVFVLDKLTYVANKENLNGLKHRFFHEDIGNYDAVCNILINNKIDIIVNFAAETHVDNSISNPGIFIETNVVGTYHLLRAAMHYQANFNTNLKFLHVSTDEVFGDLEKDDPRFNENTPYNPSSPYSSSKASSDHLVRSWIRTYGLNALITNCSNNYGLFQHTEKLIPKTIRSCKFKEKIFVYGNGLNIRDWIWAEDHCMGIYLALQNFKVNNSYCFGGDCEKTNIDIIKIICKIFKEQDDFDYESLITFVEDRKGHDFRYALDSSKAKRELGFDNQDGKNLEANLRILTNN